MFLGCFFYLYHRLSSLPNGFEFSAPIHYDFLTFLIILIPINFFIEWQKWNVILENQTVDARQKFHSFLSGIVSAVITPAYAGNFIGRMLYFPKSSRKSIVVNTLASNGSQFIISVVMGIIAFQFIYSSSISLLYHILLFLANASLIILYFCWREFHTKTPFQFLKGIGDAVSRN